MKERTAALKQTAMHQRVDFCAEPYAKDEREKEKERKKERERNKRKRKEDLVDLLSRGLCVCIKAMSYSGQEGRVVICD